MNGLALSVCMMLMSGSFSSNPVNSLLPNNVGNEKPALQQIAVDPSIIGGKTRAAGLQVADHPATVTRNRFGASPFEPRFGIKDSASTRKRTALHTGSTASYPAGLEVEEVRFVELINMERGKKGLPSLEVDDTLVKAARSHSRDMYDKYYFSHDAPDRDLRTPMKRYLKALNHRPRYAIVGENIAYCSEVNIAISHKALMDSDGHRANILDSRYDAVGVGVFKGSDGTFYVTQMFLGRSPH